MPRRRFVFGVTATVLACMGAVAWSQTDGKAPPVDRWAPFRVLEGRWEGTGVGYDGRTRRHEQFRFMLDGKFLQITSTTVFPSERGKPQRDNHKDLAVVSFDRKRQQYIIRRFDSDRFVVHYAMETQSADLKTFVFTSEDIESLPSFFKMRLTYKIINNDEYEVLIETQGPDGGFDLHSRTGMKRQK